MCQIGDIIVVTKVKNYQTSNNKHGDIGRHSFVVLDNHKGEFEGMPFDMVCNLMSSFDGKGEAYKNQKLKHKENMSYNPEDEIIFKGNGHAKDGFIKAGCYYLFDSEHTDYYVLGRISEDLYNQLVKYINNLNPKELKIITDNLKRLK